MYTMDKRGISAAIVFLVTSLLTSFCKAASVHHSGGTLEVRYRLEEEPEVGRYVGNVRQDANLASLYTADVMHQLQFRFLRQQQQQLPFALDVDTGVITTSGRVDRDAICPRAVTCDAKLDVAVQPAQYFRVIRVTIAILDINDNAPQFPDTAVHFQILESADVNTGLVLPVAVDPDSPEFAVRGYSDVTHSDTFKLRVIPSADDASASGELRLVLDRPLDRERVERYRLKIMAVDGGTPARSGVVDVSIEVLDVNDNSPVFERHEYEASIVENAPPRTVVARVAASDADAGLNGQIIYELSSLTASSFGHIFAVTNSSGDVYVVGTVDYEERTAYQLVIVARDLGPESVAASVTVTVKVTDTNDNPPEISVDTLTGDTAVAVASEDAKPGTFVAHIAVLDRDSGSAGQVDCIVSDNHFRLKPMTAGDSGDEYQLVTAAMLDRESRAMYDVGIVCRDRGPEPRERVERVKVRVTDVNDNAPHFRYPLYRADLIENSYVGASVLTVSASDDDEGDNAAIRYSLQGASGFEIHEESGVIKAVEAFDREVAASYRFFVVASDRGKPTSRSSSAEVIIDILDVNDEKPRFERHAYSLNVAENMPAGTEVGTVTAVDPDVGAFGHVTYSATSEMFSVDRDTGLITTLQPIDREVLPVYRLRVFATDAGTSPKTSSADVIIHIDDVNDNPPTFDRYPTSPMNTTYLVSTRAQRGYVIMRVRASDADAGVNAHVTFQLADVTSRYAADSDTSVSGLFHVDRELGIVSVATSLSERDGMTYDLIIVAMDGGEPPMSAFVTVSICVNSSVIDAPMTAGADRRRWVVARQNLLVVVALAVISGLITVCLVVAIVCIRRGDRRRRKPTAAGGGGGGARPGKTRKYSGRMESGDGDHDEPLQSAPLAIYNGIDKSCEPEITTCCGAEQETKLRLSSRVLRPNYRTDPPRYQSFTASRATSNHRPVAPNSSPYVQKANHDVEGSRQNWNVHQLLQRLKNVDVLDGVSLHSTEEGSNTDSGRGASEPDAGAAFAAEHNGNNIRQCSTIQTNNQYAHQLTPVPEDSACFGVDGTRCQGNGIAIPVNGGSLARNHRPTSSRPPPVAKRSCLRQSTAGAPTVGSDVELTRSPRRADVQRLPARLRVNGNNSAAAATTGEQGSNENNNDYVTVAGTTTSTSQAGYDTEHLSGVDPALFPLGVRLTTV